MLLNRLYDFSSAPSQGPSKPPTPPEPSTSSKIQIYLGKDEVMEREGSHGHSNMSEDMAASQGNNTVRIQLSSLHSDPSHTLDQEDMSFTSSSAGSSTNHSLASKQNGLGHTRQSNFLPFHRQRSEPLINNYDFNITNNNYYSSLPECIALLLSQASASNYARLEKSVMKKLLGKRTRENNEN